MMYRFVLQKSVTVRGLRWGSHISHVTSDRVWISDGYGNLILTNTRGEELHHLTDIGSAVGGHTVNSNGDLIYIHSSYNIIKLSTGNKVKTTIIQNIKSPWRPESVYSSPSNGDLLVVMFNYDTETGKVVRYNSTGEDIQTIRHNDNTDQGLYRLPSYITENRNGDVIVSDWGRGVVVTDRDGNYRFSYTGPPSGSGIIPHGICTDALSHILVCDEYTGSVQMLDSEGHYLTQIHTRQHRIDILYGLSYDDDTRLLWVGSPNNNTVNIYRVVHGDSLTGLPLEDFKCWKHPSRPLSQFCIPCDVTFCQMCIRTSDDHKRHDVQDVEKVFREIHKRKDGDAFLMCLLLCPSYKINLEADDWIHKYNAVAKVFKFKKIKKPPNLSSLKKYKPILKHDSVIVEFSRQFFRDTSFLRFARDQKFVNMFLDWAEKKSIAKYCRSSNYLRKETEEEVCCWLLPNQTEQLIERLGEDMFTHVTMMDQSIHELVYTKLGIPVQIIMRGDESVRNFLGNLKKGETTMYHASGMIIGCAGSGKSTLLERLKGIDLKEILKNSTSTRGIDVQSDVFDVTDTTVRVNTSNEKQRFKVKIDESSEQKTFSNQHAKLSGDLLRLDIKETVDQMDVASIANEQESVSDEEITHKSLDSDSESLKGNEAAAFVEKEKEMVEDSRQEKSEISGILRVSKNVLDDPEKKITMVDFAGQCSYYASHQIFLSPRAFFILVLNMEKKFDEKVGKEVCSQEGSVYEGWTHKDYLTFWAKSIHQYSSEKAPVILVGTHAEQKTKEEKEKFFREIWTTLETTDESLQKHIDRKRMFAVGFHENECIEKIKMSVVDVVQQLDHWGEKLPHSWAMFENYFKEKKLNLKIISKETLLAFNKALPQELKLKTVEDINTMLQFFHDIREILYFDQESLRGIIILDVQWFADAFKNVITDKNHAAEDLFKLASEWNKFNETGDLSDTLLSAIWKMNNCGYLEHKEDIMRYMEKLGLLVKTNDNKWYVPCMNKRPFPSESFSSFPASSILCYTFDVLPAGIFQRLVASCMRFPWHIVKENKIGKEQPCIYQTAAVFLFEKQCALLGMTQSDIQLQVYVIEGEVDIPTCLNIRKKIEDELHTLSSTFQRNLKFQIGFKCKPFGFCDNEKSHVIKESGLTEPTLLCPFCPVERKHIIDTTEIIKYWKQMKASAPKIPIASGQDLGDRSRFAKLGMATNDVLNQAYRDILEMEVPPSDIEKKVKTSPVYKRLRTEQELILQDAKHSGYKNFDISLTYTLIRNICKKIPLPTKGKW